MGEGRACTMAGYLSPTLFWCCSSSRRYAHARWHQSLCYVCFCLPLTQPSRPSFTSPPLSHSRGPRRIYCQVYAILGTNFFSHRTPQHFGNFHTSLFTMFQVMSGGACLYRVRACVLLYMQVARALVCGTHVGVCVCERGSIRVDEELTPSAHWLLQTRGRAAWRVGSSVSARVRRGLFSFLAVSLSPAHSLDQYVFSHTVRHSAWANGR